MAVDALAHEPGAMDVRYSVRSPVGRLRRARGPRNARLTKIVQFGQLSHTASGRRVRSGEVTGQPGGPAGGLGAG